MGDLTPVLGNHAKGNFVYNRVFLGKIQRFLLIFETEY